MTRVDFYILQDVDESARHRFACRLACKAVTGGNSVVMHTDNQSTAEQLDEMLWHYPDQRFIPHNLETVENATIAPVILTWTEPERCEGVLINLTSGVPKFFGRFDRVAEIVVQQAREGGRERYKFYRDRGFPLHHHDLDEWETA